MSKVDIDFGVGRGPETFYFPFYKVRNNPPNHFQYIAFHEYGNTEFLDIELNVDEGGDMLTISRTISHEPLEEDFMESDLLGDTSEFLDIKAKTFKKTMRLYEDLKKGIKESQITK